MSDIRGEIIFAVGAIVVLICVGACQHKSVGEQSKIAVPIATAEVTAVMYPKPQYVATLIEHLPVAGEVTIKGKTYYIVGE